MAQVGSKSIENLKKFKKEFAMRKAILVVLFTFTLPVTAYAQTRIPPAPDRTWNSEIIMKIMGRMFDVCANPQNQNACGQILLDRRIKNSLRQIENIIDSTIESGRKK